MTEPASTARAALDRRNGTALAVRAWVERRRFWIGVAMIAGVAAAFLVHQLMAWPPHEDETLALFVGRDSLFGVVEHVTRERGGAPFHFLVAWAVAHLGLGLGTLRLVSAAAAVGSLPLVAHLGRRLVGDRAALLGTALLAGSWLFLFHGVYARMYGIFLLVSLLSLLALLRAVERGGRGPWGLWVATILLGVATHPYGILVLGGQVLFVAVARRDRWREAAWSLAAIVVLGIPFWLTDLVLAGRFEVGVGGGGAKLGGPGSVARYLWSAAGDASAGWRPVTAAVLVLALLGVVRMRREPRLLVLALVLAPSAAFLAARMGGAAAPESRHLIFVAPLLSLATARGIVEATRRLPALAPVVVALLLVAEVGWAWHRTSALFEWEPDKRQASRAAAERWLAETGRPDDVLFGYEPLYLGAWETARDGFSRTVVPRADSVLALRALERAAPLGRGVWIFDASERNNMRPALEIEERLPTPAAPFEVRAFGPFLVVRTREPTVAPRRYLYLASRAMLVGRGLGVGDVDVNMLTVERAARVERGYGASRRSGTDGSR